MERDDYWYMFTDADSGTRNSAPIWTLRRNAWEKLGGRTVGTADPPKSRKGIQEGDATNKTTIGVLKKGRAGSSSSEGCCRDRARHMSTGSASSPTRSAPPAKRCCCAR